MIKVLRPGFYTSIQDTGRKHSRNFGIPTAGVMDCHSAKLANLLVGNYDDKAVMEITLQGPALQFINVALFALTGADLRPTLNNQPIKLHQTQQAKRGDVLQFGERKNGVRCYMAVAGGFETEMIYGSRSYYKGITKQSIVEKGDELPIGHSNYSHLSSIDLKSTTRKKKLTVTEGPEFELLNKSQREKLFKSSFTVGFNNRMAYQVEESFKNNLPSILSSAVQPGTVQLTPSGKLIILMRDCQTTGGYPRILQLTEEAICTLSQKMQGEEIRFSKSL